MKGRPLILSLMGFAVFAAMATAFIWLRPQALTKLVVADASQPAFALIYIANAKGFFADRGLEVSFRKFASGREALKSVLKGQADVATVFETPIIVNVGKGVGLKVLTALHSSTENTSMIARRDRGIENAADLVGKNIGVTLNTNAEFFLFRFLAIEGIPREAVNIISLKPHEMTDAFTTGRVDAIATWNPHLYHARKLIPAKHLRYFSSTAYTEISVLAALAKTVVKKRAMFMGLVGALVEAEKYILNNSAEAIDITSRHLSGRLGDLIRATWSGYTFRTGLSNTMLSLLTEEAKWYAERGSFPLTIPDFREFMEPSFLNEFNPTAVTVTFENFKQGIN